MLYIGSTLVGNATHVVANVLTCNTLSPKSALASPGVEGGINFVYRVDNIHKLAATSSQGHIQQACTLRFHSKQHAGHG